MDAAGWNHLFDPDFSIPGFALASCFLFLMLSSLAGLIHAAVQLQAYGSSLMPSTFSTASILLCLLLFFNLEKLHAWACLCGSVLMLCFTIYELALNNDLLYSAFFENADLKLVLSGMTLFFFCLAKLWIPLAAAVIISICKNSSLRRRINTLQQVQLEASDRQLEQANASIHLVLNDLIELRRNIQEGIVSEQEEIQTLSRSIRTLQKALTAPRSGIAAIDSVIESYLKKTPDQRLSIRLLCRLQPEEEQKAAGLIEFLLACEKAPEFSEWHLAVLRLTETGSLIIQSSISAEDLEIVDDLASLPEIGFLPGVSNFNLFCLK